MAPTDPVPTEASGQSVVPNSGGGAEPLVPADCQWPIVVGIDPGTRIMGYGALVVAPRGPRLVAAGVFRTPRSADPAQRLGHLSEELERLFERTRPDVVVVEGAFAARNARSALRLGEARGVALAWASRAGARVSEIAPAAAKKAVLGQGAGSKEQVARMVAIHLGLEELPGPLDLTDALALALAEVRRIQFNR